MYLTYSGGIHSFIMVNKALDFVYLVNNISLDVKLLPLFMFTC